MIQPISISGRTESGHLHRSAPTLPLTSASAFAPASFAVTSLSTLAYPHNSLPEALWLLAPARQSHL